MTPQPSAPAITIMRRLYAGLTGILPEIDEINKFNESPSDEKYEILIQELLENPRMRTLG